jgi:hypothetical protein
MPSTACVTVASSSPVPGPGDPRASPRGAPAADGEPSFAAGGAATPPWREAVATRDKAGGLAVAFSLEAAGGGVPPLAAPALGEDCCDRDACCGGVRRGSSPGLSLMLSDAPGLVRSELVRRIAPLCSTAGADAAPGASGLSADASMPDAHRRSAADAGAYPKGQVSTSHRIGHDVVIAPHHVARRRGEVLRWGPLQVFSNLSRKSAVFGWVCATSCNFLRLRKVADCNRLQSTAAEAPYFARCLFGSVTQKIGDTADENIESSLVLFYILLRFNK